MLSYIQANVELSHPAQDTVWKLPKHDCLYIQLSHLEEAGTYRIINKQELIPSVLSTPMKLSPRHRVRRKPACLF
jgi:hypothetical protein